MKRFAALAAAVLCCASSAFAWDSESFIADCNDFYGFESVKLMSLDHGVSSLASSSNSASDNLLTDPSLWSPSGKWAIQRQVSYTLAGVKLDYPQIETYDVGSVGFDLNHGVLRWLPGYISFPDPSSESSSVVTYDKFQSNTANEFVLTAPIDGTSNTIEFNFSMRMRMQGTVQSGSDYGTAMDATRYVIKVNGNSVYDSTMSFGNFASRASLIYTDNKPITNIQIIGYFSNPWYSGSVYGGNQNCRLYMFFDPASTFSYSLLTDNDVLNGYNDNAQQSINDHESIESQWTGSMTSNFDALDPESFTYPGGLISGFSLITGIFNDLWNGMGEYKILYVFPLTLGIMLLVIGKLSKFAGHGSSARKSGDNGA